MEIAPCPLPKQSEKRIVKPEEKNFTGFIFKIHANMDPNHRNRLAFVKIVSGIFKRNTPYLHVRNKKNLKFSSPNSFFAEKKEIVEISYPGDIVGLHDSGNFKIGDTLTSGENLNFKGIPNFSPEHFRYINNTNPMKAKQLEKGINQLMDEGIAQLFVLNFNGRKIIGTVGALQFDVIQYRLLHEYGAQCDYENINIYKACWVDGDKESSSFNDFKRKKQKFLARDKKGRLVYLSDSEFTLKMAQQNYGDMRFHFYLRILNQILKTLFFFYALPVGPKFNGILGGSFVSMIPFDFSYLWILSFKAILNLFACSGVNITLDFTFAFGDPGITFMKSTMNSDVE